MKLEIYAIKDAVVGEFQNPYLQHNRAHAVRTLKEVVNAPMENNINKNPGDMQLWQLGVFDSITGEIENKVEFVDTAINHKMRPEA